MQEDAVTIDDILNYPYWRHRIDLGDGNVTPGTKDSSDWKRLNLPETMDGKSFLDIGAFDGLHSFEAERRGAERILATDIWGEGGNEEWWFGREPKEEGLKLVRDYLNSKVEQRTISVENISPDTIGQFDITVCSKVLPFVDDPLSVVENLVSVSNERVVIESATPTLGLEPSQPVMEFAKETTANPNRRWHPTLNCLEKMLEHAGCARTESDNVPNTVANVTEGTVVQETTVYRYYTLDDEVDTIPPNTPVKILYRQQNSCRVEYRKNPSEPYRQGWVQKDEVTEEAVNESRRLLRRAVEIVREEGLLQLPPKALQYVASSSNSENILVHGYIA